MEFEMNLQLFNDKTEVTTTAKTIEDVISSTGGTSVSVAETIITTVSDVTTDASNKLAAKIAELASEIKTTHSIWVKIRNTAEIAVLSSLLAKAAEKVAESRKV